MDITPEINPDVDFGIFKHFLEIPESIFYGIFYGNFELFDKNITNIIH